MGCDGMWCDLERKRRRFVLQWRLVLPSRGQMGLRFPGNFSSLLQENSRNQDAASGVQDLLVARCDDDDARLPDIFTTDGMKTVHAITRRPNDVQYHSFTMNSPHADARVFFNVVSVYELWKRSTLIAVTEHSCFHLEP